LQQEQFTAAITELMALPPQERHERMLALHRQIYEQYTTAVSGITDEAAAIVVEDGKDQRTLLQIVGHLAEWNRFAIMSACDILAGVELPRMISDVSGFVQIEGRQLPFDDADDFNAYHAEQYKDAPWKKVQALALDTATVLLGLFTEPSLLSAERLERTRSSTKRLNDGTRVNDIAAGWDLWLTVLQHEGVEHAAQLGIPDA
jgi:hypothetical protein